MGIFLENLYLFPRFDGESTELRAEMGFGTIAGNTGGSTVTDTITFTTAFSATPFIWVTNAGRSTSGTSWGDNTLTGSAGDVIASFRGPSTSGFTVALRDANSNFPNTDNYFYTWLAIGEK